MIDRIIVSKAAENTRLTLLAAKKDHIQQQITLWENLQIEPEIISCEPIALSNFSQLFSGITAAHFVVHIARDHTTCILVKQGRLLAAQSSHHGFSDFSHALEKDRKDVESLTSLDLSAIDSKEYPSLFQTLENWRLETSRLLFALAKQTKESDIEGILMSGEGASLINLGVLLCQKAHKELIQPAQITGFSLTVPELQKYAVPIGAALSGLPLPQDQVNFRQKEFAYPYPWKRLKSTLALYFGLCLALAFSFYIFGNSYLHYKESLLKQEYVNLLTSMNKSYAAFEAEFMRKNPSQNGNEAILPVESLSKEEILDRLQLLQKELKSTPEMFPLLPNVPRVSDVLAWISSHPNVVGKKEDESVLSPSSLIQIENFSYTMLKRPELKKKQEKYQVKVELEFTSATPKIAREFHDALIAPNDFVDPKSEVKWNTNKGKYRTSFFLKDKTIYTPISS